MSLQQIIILEIWNNVILAFYAALLTDY